MHVYIAGLAGAGMQPLAIMAEQLGYQVSGSDLVDDPFFEVMGRWRPKPDVNIGQTRRQIAATHARRPIDWYIYSSALPWSNPRHPELVWARENKIKSSKRDEFLNHLLSEYKLDLLAVAGTHGKTTTTALLIWGLQQLKTPVSYAIGGKLVGQPPAAIVADSRWFVYEADEFDYNFLAFRPRLSLITGLDYDHHEVYRQRQDYYEAFRQFIEQSRQVIIAEEDWRKLSDLDFSDSRHVQALDLADDHRRFILPGWVNRQNAALALAGLRQLLPETSASEIIETLNRFPGSWRRFEKLAPNLYTDYAHTPPKIAGCLQRARELKQPVVVVYEPHSNVRQQHVKREYEHLFDGVEKIYWLPTHQAREDEDLKILTPEDLIGYLSRPRKAEPARMDDALKAAIEEHLRQNHLVVALSAGKLDGWLRQNLAQSDCLKF